MPTERPRFISSYYQIWVYYIVERYDDWEELPQASLVTSSKRDLLLKLEMLEWIHMLFFRKLRESAILAKPWERDSRRMWQLIGDLLPQVNHDETCPNAYNEIPLWTVLDEFLDHFEISVL